MTTAGDSAEGGNALAKKVQCASFDISLYPNLEALAAQAGKICSACLAEAANMPAPSSDIDAVMQNAQVMLDGLSEDGASYWFGDASDDRALLVGLSAPFVSGLSEAFLGGGFTPSEEASAPTALDSELAQLFANQLVARINQQLVILLEDVRAGDLAFRRAVTSRKTVFMDRTPSAVFKLDVSFKLDSGELKSPLSLYFPIDYLEHKGLLAQARKSAIVQEQNTKWYADMLDNVHNSEIELPVVMAKYKMTLSELMRLNVDQLIPLEEDAHNTLDITLKTNEGVVTICKGRLGTYKKNKAAKVVSDVSVA